jgi:hypothetical protein
MSAAPESGPKPLSRRVYFTVLGVLVLFWSSLIVCVAVVFAMAAWENGDGDDAQAAAPSATAVAGATATATPAVPRPTDVPLSASPVDGAFDTGPAAEHLFFHIGCDDGVLVIVTTDEHVYAETFCDSIPPELRVEFLGRPVRITISEGRLDLVSVDGARLQFGVQRAWVELR